LLRHVRDWFRLLLPIGKPKAMWKLSQKSLNRMEGVHSDLRRLMEEAIKHSPHDFGITEGLRSVSRQQKLVMEGKSKTMNSRHLTGHAVDIVVYVDGKVTWDFKYYEQVAGHILGLAAKMDIPIVWGGSWKTFKDGVHFELSKGFYKK